MKKIWIILFVCAAVFSHAQGRDDMLIFIPMPTGGSTEEQRFFQGQFEMETAAAGYTITDRQRASDYIIELNIKDNLILYDDGTTGPPEEDDPLKILELRLVQSDGNIEMVRFEWPFDYMEEMLDYDLFLLYQAMANVPMTKSSGLEIQHWRNKWVYIRASFDYPITFYALKSDGLYGGAAIYDGTLPVPDLYQELDHKITPLPAASFGLEFQFLNWMSAEFDFTLDFGDPWTKALIPGIQLELKFPIKPATQFMIEPYAAALFPMNTSPVVEEFPLIGVGGGIQLGVRGGSMGAFFVDVNFIYNLGDVVITNTDKLHPNPATIHYNRFVLGVGVGYKVGFVNRIKE